MFSFIDDIPSAEQIKARVRDDIKKYKIDEYVRNARLVQTANRLYNDEELKINPVAWIWKRLPSVSDMAQWRVVSFSKRHKVAIAGFCAGAGMLLILNGVVIAGNFGGASDDASNRTIVYPNL